ncbi:hypothetical protein F5Y16DRAFT_184423 [Xylariaceae sp. FL0255]|nr:hypothetical protein F5Y16DRAFT_184423 [Xylariaceae sp. FL0255]
MASIPFGWESDYDGARWFYRYKVTGAIQYHFPQPGDEYAEFLNDDGGDAPLKLTPEESLALERENKRMTMSEVEGENTFLPQRKLDNIYEESMSATGYFDPNEFFNSAISPESNDSISRSNSTAERALGPTPGPSPAPAFAELPEAERKVQSPVGFVAELATMDTVKCAEELAPVELDSNSMNPAPIQTNNIDNGPAELSTIRTPTEPKTPESKPAPPTVQSVQSLPLTSASFAYPAVHGSTSPQKAATPVTTPSIEGPKQQSVMPVETGPNKYQPWNPTQDAAGTPEPQKPNDSSGLWSQTTVLECQNSELGTIEEKNSSGKIEADIPSALAPPSGPKKPTQDGSTASNVTSPIPSALKPGSNQPESASQRPIPGTGARHESISAQGQTLSSAPSVLKPGGRQQDQSVSESGSNVDGGAAAQNESNIPHRLSMPVAEDFQRPGQDGRPHAERVNTLPTHMASEASSVPPRVTGSPGFLFFHEIPTSSNNPNPETTPSLSESIPPDSSEHAPVSGQHPPKPTVEAVEEDEFSPVIAPLKFSRRTSKSSAHSSIISEPPKPSTSSEQPVSVSVDEILNSLTPQGTPTQSSGPFNPPPQRFNSKIGRKPVGSGSIRRKPTNPASGSPQSTTTSAVSSPTQPYPGSSSASLNSASRPSSVASSSAVQPNAPPGQTGALGMQGPSQAVPAPLSQAQKPPQGSISSTSSPVSHATNQPHPHQQASSIVQNSATLHNQATVNATANNTNNLSFDPNFNINVNNQAWPPSQEPPAANPSVPHVASHPQVAHTGSASLPSQQQYPGKPTAGPPANIHAQGGFPGPPAHHTPNLFSLNQQPLAGLPMSAQVQSPPLAAVSPPVQEPSPAVALPVSPIPSQVSSPAQSIASLHISQPPPAPANSTAVPSSNYQTTPAPVRPSPAPVQAPAQQIGPSPPMANPQSGTPPVAVQSGSSHAVMPPKPFPMLPGQVTPLPSQVGSAPQVMMPQPPPAQSHVGQPAVNGFKPPMNQAGQPMGQQPILQPQQSGQMHPVQQPPQGLAGQSPSNVANGQIKPPQQQQGYFPPVANGGQAQPQQFQPGQPQPQPGMPQQKPPQPGQPQFQQQPLNGMQRPPINQPQFQSVPNGGQPLPQQPQFQPGPNGVPQPMAQQTQFQPAPNGGQQPLQQPQLQPNANVKPPMMQGPNGQLMQSPPFGTPVNGQSIFQQPLPQGQQSVQSPMATSPATPGAAKPPAKPAPPGDVGASMKKWGKKMWSNPKVRQATAAVAGALVSESLGGSALGGAKIANKIYTGVSNRPPLPHAVTAPAQAQGIPQQQQIPLTQPLKPGMVMMQPQPGTMNPQMVPTGQPQMGIPQQRPPQPGQPQQFQPGIPQQHPVQPGQPQFQPGNPQQRPPQPGQPMQFQPGNPHQRPPQPGQFQPQSGQPQQRPPQPGHFQPQPGQPQFQPGQGPRPPQPQPMQPQPGQFQPQPGQPNQFQQRPPPPGQFQPQPQPGRPPQPGFPQPGFQPVGVQTPGRPPVVQNPALANGVATNFTGQAQVNINAQPQPQPVVVNTPVANPAAKISPTTQSNLNLGANLLGKVLHTALQPTHHHHHQNPTLSATQATFLHAQQQQAAQLQQAQLNLNFDPTTMLATNDTSTTDVDVTMNMTMNVDVDGTTTSVTDTMSITETVDVTDTFGGGDWGSTVDYSGGDWDFDS